MNIPGFLKECDGQRHSECDQSFSEKKKKGKEKSSYLVRISLFILLNLCGCGCNGQNKHVTFPSGERAYGHFYN